MEKTAESQMSSSSSSSSLCFFKPSLLSIAILVLVPSVAFTCFLTFGFSIFLVTIPLLFLSTIFIVSLSKQKVMEVVENPCLNEGPKSMLETEVVEERPTQELDTVSQYNDTQQSEIFRVVESRDFPSKSSESSDDDFSARDDIVELSWMCSDKLVRDVAAISESSLSEEEEDDDDDDLIEISLPKNDDSVDMNEVSKQQKLQSHLADSILRQEGLIMEELLAESINEMIDEENLIEIDLSMGSIKCPSFGIEA